MVSSLIDWVNVAECNNDDTAKEKARQLIVAHATDVEERKAT